MVIDQLPVCTCPAVPREMVRKMRLSPLPGTITEESMNTWFPPGKLIVVVEGGFTVAVAAPPGRVTDTPIRSAPRYQRSTVTCGTPPGTLNCTVCTPPPVSVPLACRFRVPSFPADFTKARPAPPNRLSRPRSSKLVPSCGPTLSP